MNAFGTLKICGFALFVMAMFFSLQAADPLAIIGTQNLAALKIPAVTGPKIWKDSSPPIEVRIHDLVSRMSLAEKASQLMADVTAVLRPKLALCGFSRVYLAQGTSSIIRINLPVERFRYWNTIQKQCEVEPGGYELLVGAASDDIRWRVPLKIVLRT